MRPGRILHPQIAGALASLGHGDIILVTDAGAPIPADARRIDLAFYPGTVDLLEILRVLRQEIFIENVIFASEVEEGNPRLFTQVTDIFTGSGADFTLLPHGTLVSDVYHKARFVIRSGSLIPWGNFGLVASTDPDAWFDDTMKMLPEYEERSRRIKNRAVPRIIKSH
ncbi:carbohydrate transporter [Enterobacteriaceae bacterium BIT-l23]|uniref:D-ribose pyranase n=1 Tax=Jejubacter calystegiae TaxID=2579935 RepID=A0A4P8YC78_9ENTR|nr:RbsD/FucU domain-containing protein [Jejubacter calystegiae]NUU67114.1 carbohydrate transporter [Enterobacteriaceae bacterium BIT-l23]QCT18145.1 carbohydrate transporter [Jejubacter calystegiae]